MTQRIFTAIAKTLGEKSLALPALFFAPLLSALPWDGNSEDLGNGWSATWMGAVYTEHAPWYFSENLDWYYTEGTAQSLWFHERTQGWMWTRGENYPSAYQAFYKEWWMLGGGSPGERTHFNFWTGTFLSEQAGPGAWLNDRFDRTLRFAEKRGLSWIGNVASDRFPNDTNRVTGAWQVNPASHWTSGFYPATLWQLYNLTDVDAFRVEALRKTRQIESQASRTDTHDLGFMIFLPTALAMQHSNHPAHRTTILTAADSLASRFSETVGVTRSWDWGDFGNFPRFTVIVDNMMNLELLLWASDQGNRSTYATMAMKHADTTTRDFFRPDDSTWHVVVYDQRDGSIELKRTWQGLSDDSTWSRGQAWAIHGYTALYRMTGEVRFREQVDRALAYYLAKLPADGVPPYDFDVPAANNPSRDTSAAAIVASALIEMASLVEDGAAYLENAIWMLNSLASPLYLSDGRREASLLRHGSHAHNNQNTGLIYGDYYFLEAIARWRALGFSEQD